jgi:SAM-dependent methyltransferase
VEGDVNDVVRSDDYGATGEFYDYVPPYMDRTDIDFWVTEAVASGGPVLEVGCGTGRVLVPIARAGIEIVGLDLSSAMLALCASKLAGEPTEVAARTALVEADMRDFHLGHRFALAILPFRPFQHLITVEDQVACLESICRHLAPGSRLILDLFNPSLPFLVDDNRQDEYGDEPEFAMPDGRRVVRRFRTARRDWLHQVQDVELIYYVTHFDGRHERLVHAFPMRYLFRYEAEHLLVRCGFSIEAVYADFARNPYGSAYPGELIFVARR